MTDRWRGGGGGVTDRWSPALEKRAARQRVLLSAKARGAVAGRGGLTDRWKGGAGADKKKTR